MRSETLRGYTLLSPTLIVMTVGIIVPFTILLAMSFWTQHAFDFDTTFTFANYQTAADEPVYSCRLSSTLRSTISAMFSRVWPDPA